MNSVRIALADTVQKVEPLGLRELQRLADPPVQPHLVVDRFARGLELFLMTVPGGVEQLANDTVVQIDHFVGDSGRALDGDRHGRGISPLGLELGEVGRRHLATFAGDLEEAVLMDCPIDADGKVQRPPGLQPFDVLAHVPRVWFDRRLAQPGQPCCLAAVTALEQLVQAVNGEAIVLRCGEALQAQVGLQFEQVLAARLGPLAVSAPGIRGTLIWAATIRNKGTSGAASAPRTAPGNRR